MLHTHFFAETGNNSETQILLQCNRRNTILSGSCYTRGLWHVWSSGGAGNKAQPCKWYV